MAIPNDTRVLLHQANLTLNQVNDQLDQLLDVAKKEGVRPAELRSMDGSILMIELLLAKAQAINAIATLKGLSK